MALCQVSQSGEMPGSRRGNAPPGAVVTTGHSDPVCVRLPASKQSPRERFSHADQDPCCHVKRKGCDALLVKEMQVMITVKNKSEDVRCE